MKLANIFAYFNIFNYLCNKFLKEEKHILQLIIKTKRKLWVKNKKRMLLLLW